ncbi:S1 RNA-binding domain-containing protein [Streptomyces sp. NPDC001107]
MANLLRSLDARTDDLIGDGPWGPDTGVAGVRLARLLARLGLRHEAERVFRVMSGRLRQEGVPESEWDRHADAFVNCLGVLGISLGLPSEAREVLRHAVRDAETLNLSAAEVAAQVNLAAVELDLDDADAALDHVLGARAMLETSPDPDLPRWHALHTVLGTVEHQLVGLEPRFGDHAKRVLAALARRAGERLDGLDDADPRAYMTVVGFAMTRTEAAVRAGDIETLETVAKVVEVAVQRLATLLGADHPQVLAVQADLAAVQIETARAVRSPARLERAARLLAATAQRLEFRLGPAHPRTVAALTNLVSAEVEMVRALPEPGKAERTADALAERALKFRELLGARHPVTRLATASAAHCRQMAAGEDGGRDLGGTTLVRTLIDSAGDWQRDGEAYRSFRDAVSEVGPSPRPMRVVSETREGDGFPLGSAVTGVEREGDGFPLGSVVTGVVRGFDEKEVEVHVGRYRAVIPRTELAFSDEHGLRAGRLRLGDDLDAVVVGIETSDTRRVLLSRQLVFLSEALRRREAAEAAGVPPGGATVCGRVAGVVDGGLAVKVADVVAFLPTEDVELEPVGDRQRYVGQIIDAKAWITPSGSVVLSRRAWLEEAAVLPPQLWLAHLRVGHVRTGTVTRFTEQDVVVDLGSFRGLLDQDAPSTTSIGTGDQVTVRILAVDEENAQVFVELVEDEKLPWQKFADSHRLGRIVRGTATRISSNGVHVRLTGGIDGFVPIGQLADDQRDSEGPTVADGAEIYAQITKIDTKRHGVALSVRKADAVFGSDPWSTEFMPACYEDAGDPDHTAARDVFELHREHVMSRRGID